MADEGGGALPSHVVQRILESFLVFESSELLGTLANCSFSSQLAGALIKDVHDGLRSAVSAATLPYRLTYHSVQQRHFDRILSAETIRCLKDVGPVHKLTDELKAMAFEKANKNMHAFLQSSEGLNAFRNGVVRELESHLDAIDISAAASELLVQTLISTWSIFESSLRTFIVGWINEDASRAQKVLVSSDLKSYFGKPVVDLEVIGAHGFDLTKSMGEVIFGSRRLDSLQIIRSVLEALFQDQAVRSALGKEIRELNQRRHLFVHRRGIVDPEYLQRTSDGIPAGSRLTITSFDVEKYMKAVRTAAIAIASAADQMAE